MLERGLRWGFKQFDVTGLTGCFLRTALVALSSPRQFCWRGVGVRSALHALRSAHAHERERAREHYLGRCYETQAGFGALRVYILGAFG